MKKVLITLIFLLNFPLFAQEQKLVYQEESLVTVIKDLEEKAKIEKKESTMRKSNLY